MFPCARHSHDDSICSCCGIMDGNMSEEAPSAAVIPTFTLNGVTDRRFSPEGDGVSGRRPLPPNHFTIW